MIGCAMALTMVCLCAVVVVYTGAVLATAETLRHRLPVVGPLVADEIERWLEGEEVELTVDDIALSGNNPPNVMGIYSGPIEEDEECQTPGGWPVAGRFVRGYHPPDAPGHSGIDISVPTGTPDMATMCGTVVFAGWSDVGYGYLVIVRNGNYDTYYAHNSSLLVSPGQWVEAGQSLALSGSTGNSTGPHVHYEVRLGGAPVDPMGFP